MLVPDFYRILKFKSSDHNIEAMISLNEDHKIYKGHFPGQPVVPGVMQLQMIKELVEKAKEQEFIMSNITVAKFLNIIVPTANKEINVEIDLAEAEEDQYKINAKLSGNELVFTKLKANLSVK